MTIPKEIADLVQVFEYHRPAYLRGQEHYNEAQLRIQYVDPFFRAFRHRIGAISEPHRLAIGTLMRDLLNLDEP